MSRAQFETDLHRDGYDVEVGEIKPDQHRPPHAHDYDVRFLVLDGSIVIVFGTDRRVFGPGDTCSVPAKTAHEEHTQADGVRYLIGRRAGRHGSATP